MWQTMLPDPSLPISASSSSLCPFRCGYIKENAGVDEDENPTVEPVTTSKKDGKKRARK